MEAAYNNQNSGARRLLVNSMARILVLGKSERDLSSIAATVAGMSHFVTSGWDLDSLSNAVANGSPDIVMIDLRSGEGALDYAKDLIANYDQVAQSPRLVVVESTNLDGLQSKYIDDFILSPFDTSELTLRIVRLLAKSQKLKGGKLITAEGLVIDTESFEVTVDSRQLSLTFKEFELLRFLAAHRGRVHTREALLNQVWGYEYFGGLRTVDVHVRRIRAKLGAKHENLIQTVHGVGYKFTG
ncbi:MAG: response regulator transcription factor [Armatimonadota bacterium]